MRNWLIVLLERCMNLGLDVLGLGASITLSAICASSIAQCIMALN